MRTTTVKKPWGSFIQFTHNEKSTVKILVVKPKEMMIGSTNLHSFSIACLIVNCSKVIGSINLPSRP